jgi:hypothetical protein
MGLVLGVSTGVVDARQQNCLLWLGSRFGFPSAWVDDLHGPLHRSCRRRRAPLLSRLSLARSRTMRSLAQSGVLEVPRVQLNCRLARTMTQPTSPSPVEDIATSFIHGGSEDPVTNLIETTSGWNFSFKRQYWPEPTLFSVQAAA